MKRIGILGGTFDPVHRGHLELARAAQKQFHLNTVYFVPSYITPLKSRIQTKARHRLNMVRRAIRPLKFARVCLYEFNRKRISYSIDTVRYFRKIRPSAEIYFVVGSDVFTNWRKWKKWRELSLICRFVAARRPGFNYQKGGNFHFLRMRPQRISSREIRSRIRSGQIKGLPVPGAVMQYIRSKQLYRRDSGA